MKMNYQSGDKLKNRYLSNDAFTSLTNKLGGRSITSLGMRRKNSYKIANQGVSLFEYKNIIYKIFISILLLTICFYIIPQTRYFLHGYVAEKSTNESLLSMEDKLDKALKEKADKAVVDKIVMIMYWLGAIVGTGFISYVGIQLVKVIEKL